MRVEDASGTIVGTAPGGQAVLFSALHVHLGDQKERAATRDKFISALQFRGFADSPSEGLSRPVKIRQASEDPAVFPAAWFEEHVLKGFDLNAIPVKSDFSILATEGKYDFEKLRMRDARDGETTVLLGFPL